jgi:hypothetical protein
MTQYRAKGSLDEWDEIFDLQPSKAAASWTTGAGATYREPQAIAQSIVGAKYNELNTIDHLSSSTEYEVRRGSYNSLKASDKGYGLFSSPPVPVRTTGEAGPSAPANLTVTGTTYDTVSLSWDAAAVPAHAPVLKYVIRYRVADVSKTLSSYAKTSVHTPTAATSYTVPNLLQDTTYTFEVAAINAVGQGSFTPAPITMAKFGNPPASVLGTTPLANSTGVPPSITGQPAWSSSSNPDWKTQFHGDMTVTWSPPSNINAPSITAYNIKYRRQRTNQDWTYILGTQTASSAGGSSDLTCTTCYSSLRTMGAERIELMVRKQYVWHGPMERTGRQKQRLGRSQP